MDASCRKVLGLISEMNVRFVVPVYQRPYSWEEEQCVQLWDDVLACGRQRNVPHFMGSIVTIQDGSLSEAGVAPLLLIDGQQRITTITLLLVALARYAATHAGENLAFSRDEIVLSGYLTNHFRSGDDHYKLTMSKGDHDTYRQLVDSLERPDVSAPEAPGARLMENLDFFEKRLQALPDVNDVWAGLQRLEVVSVSLAQGQDNPQLIFESMNSTGKDLSSADLVRNFVLMDFPMAQQQEVYRAYWSPIERILGADSHGYDKAFDDFIRCFLTSVWAPTSFARGDAYQAFKRYIVARSYNRDGRIRDFSLRLRRYARHYVDIVTGEGDSEPVADALAHIRELDVPSVRPLLLTLFNAHDQHVVSRTELASMLRTLEGYLLRRSACDLAGSVLPKFFSSLIARLDAVQNAEGDYVAAFYAMLANEDDTQCRFPDDAEFARALTTRDGFYWRDARFLLAAVDGGAEGIPAGNFASYGVEHVMPPRALADSSWLAQLGPEPEVTFERTINALGNLVLSTSEYDPQEGSLAERQAQLARDGATSSEVLAATSWGPAQVDARTEELSRRALARWPYPVADPEACRLYRRRRDGASSVALADLFQAGLVRAGERLVSADPRYPGSAIVTFDGSLMLENGQMCYTPDDATAKLLAMDGAPEGAGGVRNGWLMWRRGEGGPTLDELRGVLL